MAYVNTTEEGVREKIEDTTDSILGTSGNFDVRTSTAGVDAVLGFNSISVPGNDALLPMLIVNEDDVSEWEVGLYAHSGVNGIYERGSASGSHTIASPSTGWTNFSAGKKSISVVDISDRFQVYDVVPDPGGQSFDTSISMIRYDTNTFPQFQGPTPLTNMSAGGVGHGLLHSASVSSDSYGYGFFEKVIQRNITSNDTPKVIATVDAASLTSLITHVYGRVLISNQVNTPIAKVQEFSALVRYNSLSTATVVGTPSITTLHEDASLASAALTIALSGTTIQMTANGLADPSLQWTLELNVFAGAQ